MIRLIKILTIVTLLIFTGCDEPLGKETTTTIISTKDMDPRLKAYPEAVEWYKDSESYPEAAANLGYFYHDTLKDYKKAIQWYIKAFEGNFIKVSNNLGSAYGDLKDYNNAIKWYNISISNNIAKGHYNLAYLYHSKLKDYNNAIKYYKIAIERESSVDSALKNLAILYKDKKEYIKASAYFINLIEYQVYTKNDVLNTLKNDLKIDDETIKKGYELQLTMPGLPRRYTGGI